MNTISPENHEIMKDFPVLENQIPKLFIKHSGIPLKLDETKLGQRQWLVAVWETILFKPSAFT